MAHRIRFVPRNGAFLSLGLHLPSDISVSPHLPCHLRLSLNHHLRLFRHASLSPLYLNRTEQFGTHRLLTYKLPNDLDVFGG